MDAHTIHEATSPGWRELVEGFDEIEAARERATALLRIMEQDRQALASLTRTGRPRSVSEGTPRAPSGSPLHAQSMALLAEHPGGCARAQIEAALATDRPLADVLRGLWRRGRLARVGPGRYALPGHNETASSVDERRRA